MAEKILSGIKLSEIKLSRRLQAVADMVKKGNVVCDVGCDHGFVSIYLVKNGISPRVIAMDVNEGPLRAAREHIGEYLLTDYIETRLSDGVSALETGEADTLICAGMGGKLMKRILEEGKEKVREMKELVLQPQSEIRAVREYLRSQGYLIVDENMILEEGKYYPMMKIYPSYRKEPFAEQFQDTGDLQRIKDKYGPILLEKKNPVLAAFLRREYDICGQILDNLHKNGREQEVRRDEIINKMKDIETALSCF